MRHLRTLFSQALAGCDVAAEVASTLLSARGALAAAPDAYAGIFMDRTAPAALMRLSAGAGDASTAAADAVRGAEVIIAAAEAVAIALGGAKPSLAARAGAVVPSYLSLVFGLAATLRTTRHPAVAAIATAATAGSRASSALAQLDIDHGVLPRPLAMAVMSLLRCIVRPPAARHLDLLLAPPPPVPPTADEPVGFAAMLAAGDAAGDGSDGDDSDDEGDDSDDGSDSDGVAAGGKDAAGRRAAASPSTATPAIAALLAALDAACHTTAFAGAARQAAALDALGDGAIAELVEVGHRLLAYMRSERHDIRPLDIWCGFGLQVGCTLVTVSQRRACLALAAADAAGADAAALATALAPCMAVHALGQEVLCMTARTSIAGATALTTKLPASLELVEALTRIAGGCARYAWALERAALAAPVVGEGETAALAAVVDTLRRLRRLSAVSVQAVITTTPVIITASKAWARGVAASKLGQDARLAALGEGGATAGGGGTAGGAGGVGVVEEVGTPDRRSGTTIITATAAAFPATAAATAAGSEPADDDAPSPPAASGALASDAAVRSALRRDGLPHGGITTPVVSGVTTRGSTLMAGSAAEACAEALAPALHVLSLTASYAADGASRASSDGALRALAAAILAPRAGHAAAAAAADAALRAAIDAALEATVAGGAMTEGRGGAESSAAMADAAWALAPQWSPRPAPLRALPAIEAAAAKGDGSPLLISLADVIAKSPLLLSHMVLTLAARSSVTGAASPAATDGAAASPHAHVLSLLLAAITPASVPRYSRQLQVAMLEAVARIAAVQVDPAAAAASLAALLACGPLARGAGAAAAGAEDSSESAESFVPSVRALWVHAVTQCAMSAAGAAPAAAVEAAVRWLAAGERALCDAFVADRSGGGGGSGGAKGGKSVGKRGGPKPVVGAGKRRRRRGDDGDEEMAEAADEQGLLLAVAGSLLALARSGVGSAGDALRGLAPHVAAVLAAPALFEGDEALHMALREMAGAVTGLV